MALLLSRGSLSLDEIRKVLAQDTTWRLAEDLNDKAAATALTFGSDFTFPESFQVSEPIVRLSILLAAASSITRGESGAIIGLSLVNLFNSLPSIHPSRGSSSPFQSTVFDLTGISLTDAEFSSIIRGLFGSITLTPEDEVVFTHPHITAATVLATAALSDRLWEYVACAIGVWGELEAVSIIQTNLYTREAAPLYLSLTVQRIADIVMDSKLLKKTGSSFLAHSASVLAPLLSAIASVRTLIAKSVHISFEFYSLQAAISSLTTAILLILKYLGSLRGSEPPTNLEFKGLTLAFADGLAEFFNLVISPKLSAQQASIPAGRKLQFGLITRQFVNFLADGGITSLVSFPVFKLPEGAKREIPLPPIGTRDLFPIQMRIREKVMNTITSVFKRHGAVTIDTPVFELREVLTEKYGEDGGKLIYNLEDQGGELLSLRYDLTVPFARYVATHGESNIKRYQIAKVYRRDHPQVERGRFREFYQCDFDIAGPSGPMIADSEVLAVMVELLNSINNFARFDFLIEVSDRRILGLIVSISGVPSEKFKGVCASIDKLDKSPWADVRKELINVRGIRPESADKLWEFVQLNGDPIPTLARLRERFIAEYEAQGGGRTAYDNEASKVLNEMELLFEYLTALRILEKIKFNLALARGLDYYTGLIFEGIAVNDQVRVGSIVGGGRYDDLIGMFSGRKVPAVGGSLGIERVFTIIEESLKQSVRPVDTEVFICSIANDFTKARLGLASELWAEGIAVEFLYKAKPDAKAQFGQASACGAKLAVIIAPDEEANGTVKLKILAKNEEITIPRDEFLGTVKRLLGH
jgi:histidyl-tRNA synthetase